RCPQPHQGAARRGAAAVLRPGCRRPAAAVDPNDDRVDRHARATVQRASHGAGLRSPVLPGSRRRTKRRNEPAVTVRTSGATAGSPSSVFLCVYLAVRILQPHLSTPDAARCRVPLALPVLFLPKP